MSFHGGWVQQHPQVYLVFWGPQWTSDPAHIQVKNTVVTVFKELAGSQYHNTIVQYHGGGAAADNHVHNDVQLMDDPPWIDTTTPGASVEMDVQIESEAVKAFNHWVLPVTPYSNNQILIFPQAGTTYGPVAGYGCGMHYYDRPHELPFSVILYPEARCAFANSAAGSAAWVAVHEYADTATDPEITSPSHPLTVNSLFYGSGWNSGTGAGAEVADLCQGYHATAGGFPVYTSIGSGASFEVPYLWSEYSGHTFQGLGCVQHEGIEFASPDHTAPFTGKHTVQGSILNYYFSIGAGGSYLGRPVSEETVIGAGVVSYFAGNGNLVCQHSGATPSGAIYYSAPTGVHEVHSCLFDNYRSNKEATGVLGFPVTDMLGAPGGGGYVNYFSGNGNLVCQYNGPSRSSGGIYWSAATGAHEVHSCLFDSYRANGETGGVLGFPVTDIASMAGGNVNYFRGNGNLVCQYHGPAGSSGAIYWSSATGAHEVHSCLFDDYRANGEAAGVLGFPVSDIVAVPGGYANYFRGNGNLVCQYHGPNSSSGAVYWSAATGAHEVHSCLFDEFRASGETGVIAGPGFPVTDTQAIAGGNVSYFRNDLLDCGQRGPSQSTSGIYWSAATGAHAVRGCFFSTYFSMGGPTSALGFPTTGIYTNPAGHDSEDFQHGFMWFDGQVHVVYYSGERP